MQDPPGNNLIPSAFVFPFSDLLIPERAEIVAVLHGEQTLGRNPTNSFVIDLALVMFGVIRRAVTHERLCMDKFMRDNLFVIPGIRSNADLAHHPLPAIQAACFVAAGEPGISNEMSFLIGLFLDVIVKIPDHALFPGGEVLVVNLDELLPDPDTDGLVVLTGSPDNVNLIPGLGIIIRCVRAGIFFLWTLSLHRKLLLIYT